MHITRYTDYALRVLMYLGLKGDKLATIQEVADQYGISKNHLMKVVYDLNLKGYVETLRGKHGGIRLRARPEEINIGRLVRETETDLKLVECFGGGDDCRINPACALKGVLGEALAAFFRVLDSYTLADLLRPQPGLERLLGLRNGERERPPIKVKVEKVTPASR